MGGAHFLSIDDHALFRKGLMLLLKERYPDASMSEAESVEEAVKLAIPAPHLILLDIRLPGRRGIDGIGMLRTRWGYCPIYMVSGLDSEEAIREAFDSGASGYISKTETPTALLRKIDAAICEQCEPLGDTPPADSPADKPQKLTSRQRDILRYLCEGLPNKVIARRLSVSENTVRHHVRDILDYFSVGSRSEAAFAARQHGYAE